MNPQALLAMIGIGLVTSTALPAMAAGDLEKQLRMTDGYTVPATPSTASPGAAGRPGMASDDTWFLNQLKQTDGYTEPTAAPAPRAGAAGRAGKPESRRSGSESSPKRRLMLDLRR